MSITWVKTKEYSGPTKRVVMCDGQPIAIVRGDKRAADLMAYYDGYDVEIGDGKIKKILDRLKSQKVSG